MSGEHNHVRTTYTCNLKPYEAHLASVCVAIVCGLIARLCFMFMEYEENTVINLIVLAAYSFAVSWFVCKYLFPTAHHWYGSSSLLHRVYDSIGVLSGIGFYFLIN